MSADPPPGMTTWVNVDSLDLHHPDPANIIAFAVDQPRAGDRLRGAGFEINGWVIGRDAPVHAVRTSGKTRTGSRYPLDVRRPDVAADYSAHPHAGSAGFSAWAPIDPAEGKWRIAVEAILANGQAFTLAEIHGRLEVEPRLLAPGARPVLAPDFAIVGAQRGGTTSLHAYLGAHPQVLTAATKELHFITDRFERGLDWYLGQFPSALSPNTITGEATPYALFHPIAPRRLRAIAPEARLIVLLRNPIDRAYSHYLHERSRGKEMLDFAAALDAEPERLAGEEAALSSDPTYLSETHKHYSYMARGDYAPQLARWFDVFPREQVFVARSEDLYERSAETFARAAAFLGINPGIHVPFAVHNQTSGPPLDPEIRRRLARHFAPLHARLADLLGWDPGWS